MTDKSAHTFLNPEQDSLIDLHSEIAPDFEARTLKVIARFEEENSRILPSISKTEFSLEPADPVNKRIELKYVNVRLHSIQTALAPEEISKDRKSVV